MEIEGFPEPLWDDSMEESESATIEDVDGLYFEPGGEA